MRPAAPVGHIHPRGQRRPRQRRREIAVVVGRRVAAVSGGQHGRRRSGRGGAPPKRLRREGRPLAALVPHARDPGRDRPWSPLRPPLGRLVVEEGVEVVRVLPVEVHPFYFPGSVPHSQSYHWPTWHPVLSFLLPPALCQVHNNISALWCIHCPAGWPRCPRRRFRVMAMKAGDRLKRRPILSLRRKTR